MGGCFGGGHGSCAECSRFSAGGWVGGGSGVHPIFIFSLTSISLLDRLEGEFRQHFSVAFAQQDYRWALLGGGGEGSGDTAGIYFRALKVPLVRDQTFVFPEEEENDRKSLFVGRFTQKAVRVSRGDAIRPLAPASRRPAFSYRLC